MTVESLLYGVLFGLAAGISPGPLTTLVLSETFKNGRKKGIEAAISPPISEPPIILLVLLVLSKVRGNYAIIGAISILGPCFLAYLGLTNLAKKADDLDGTHESGNAFLKGIVTNLLNPNAYMFWLLIGGPQIMQKTQTNAPATILFIIGFYLALVGSKIAIALATHKSKTYIKSRYHVSVVRVLGLTLIATALIMLRNGLKLVGIL